MPCLRNVSERDETLAMSEPGGIAATNRESVLDPIYSTSQNSRTNESRGEGHTHSLDTPRLAPEPGLGGHISKRKVIHVRGRRCGTCGGRDLF